jgi:hypothetical protein
MPAGVRVWLGLSAARAEGAHFTLVNPFDEGATFTQAVLASSIVTKTAIALQRDDHTAPLAVNALPIAWSMRGC